MPNRIIRDAILTSEAVASLDWAAEVFYRRLHSIVDDYGRHEAGQQLLRAKCYPLQTDSVRVADIARWMAACQKSGLILVYGVNGKQYLEVCKFGQQQRSASKCPPPTADAGIVEHLLATDINCNQAPANAHLDVCVVVDVSEDDKRAVARDELFPDVDPETVRDFRRLRAAKKAPVTKTAVDGIRREADKAGLSMQSALATCCERGWTGFKADWMAGQSGVNGATPRTRNDL